MMKLELVFCISFSESFFESVQMEEEARHHYLGEIEWICGWAEFKLLSQERQGFFISSVDGSKTFSSSDLQQIYHRLCIEVVDNIHENVMNAVNNGGMFVVVFFFREAVDETRL